MKVIDANTGIEVREGMEFDNVDGHIKVIKIHPGIFKAYATLEINGVVQDVELAVRWTHPSFFLQHIAFIPS
jgi:hypothetical protein